MLTKSPSRELVGGPVLSRFDDRSGGPPLSHEAICHFYGAILCLDNLSLRWMGIVHRLGEWVPLISKLFRGFHVTSSGRDLIGWGRHSVDSPRNATNDWLARDSDNKQRQCWPGGSQIRLWIFPISGDGGATTNESPLNHRLLVRHSKYIVHALNPCPSPTIHSNMSLSRESFAFIRSEWMANSQSIERITKKQQFTSCHRTLYRDEMGEKDRVDNTLTAQLRSGSRVSVRRQTDNKSDCDDDYDGFQLTQSINNCPWSAAGDRDDEKAEQLNTKRSPGTDINDKLTMDKRGTIK